MSLNVEKTNCNEFKNLPNSLISIHSTKNSANLNSNFFQMLKMVTGEEIPLTKTLERSRKSNLGISLRSQVPKQMKNAQT